MSDTPRRYIPATKMPDKAEIIDISKDVDPLSMLNTTMEILRREVNNLLTASGRGKLDRASAADLVSYVKVLKELSGEEKDFLADLSTEELKEIVENRDAKTKSKGRSEGTSEEN